MELLFALMAQWRRVCPACDHPDSAENEIEGDLKGWDIPTLARRRHARDVPLIVSSADVKTMRERDEEFKQVGNV